jgi:hypothetical protein
VINQPNGGAPSQHDPNETPNQISEDNLTQDAPQDEDEATRTARRARNQRKGECKARAAEHARLPPRNLNHEFNNATDPIFTTPIAAMTEATLRLMQMPQNPQMEHVIHLTRHAVEQLERQNPLSSLHGTRSKATATVIPQASRTPEAIIVNCKIKETKRIRKLQAIIAPGVANHQQTKLLGLNRTATTTAVKTPKKLPIP